MADCGRNGPCRCGSGKKAKRCCGLWRGPSSTELAKAFVAEEGRRAALRLAGLARDDLEELFEQMAELPARDVRMQLPLPRVLGPELEALRMAIDADDDDGVDELLDAAVAEVDDPCGRAELARAALALAEAGRVDRRVAAAAVVDLGVASSALVRASLLQALAVSVGATRTPSGLLVVSR